MQNNQGEAIRVGIIGCGFFAANHLNAWRELRNKRVEIAAVCDLDAERAKMAAKNFDVDNWYDDASRMLAHEKLDLVDIVTQVVTHRGLAEMALGAVKGVIVQKPFATSLDDCLAIVDQSKDRNTFLAVHENFRFQYPLRRLKRILEQGIIGSPSWARISFRTNFDIFTGQPYLREEERFVVTDLGPHVLDLARFFLGEVASVTAELQHRNADVRGEDTATHLLKHTSGAVSVVECTYGARRNPDLFPQTLVEVEGDGGSIILHGDYRIDVHSTEHGNQTIDAEPDVLPWAEKPWHVVQESVLATCDHITTRFRAGLPADVSGADNAKTYALVEASYEAAAKGRSIRPRI